VKKKDGTIASTDEAWKGKQGADSQVELNSPGGWNYIYRAGRIAEAACSDGTRLRWNYQHNLFKSLSDSQQGTLVSVEYGTEGLPVKISTSKDSFTCGVQKVPVVANAAGVISGFEYTLAGISSGSRFWKSPIVLSPEGDYSMEFSNSAQPVNTFVWNAASGILKSEGGWTYEVKKRDDDRLLVSRKNHEGGVESYFYDDKTGVSEQTLPDGSRIVRSYFIGLGPTQYKIRKYAKLRNGKEIDASQWSYDEKGRTIRKISGDNQRIWGYSPDGHLLFQEETFAGALARRLTYDLHGRLASSVHPGIELRYAYDSGKRVAQRLESGKVMAAHVADTAGGPGHLFFTKSGSGELESRGEVPQKSALQELENSKIVALRAIAQLKNETPH
jgi:YD repeat-containing protein